jgi:CRISPR-associated endoribonuclease Cas6
VDDLAESRLSGPAGGGLSLARYRVTLRALEPLDLPAYLGSTLRGAFGRAFRALCCPARAGESCPIPTTCPYHLIFETAPPPDSTALRTHAEIPRPFVIAPPPAQAREYPAAAEVVFDLTLIGRARDFFPHFVVTLREVERLGRGRRSVALQRLDAVDPLQAVTRTAYMADDNLVRAGDLPITLAECAKIPCPAGGVRVRFVTQTRLKHGDTVVRRPEFQILFRRLLGRLSSLARFHCGGPLDLDFRDLIEGAGQVLLVKDETRWTTWARYSARQDRRMDWTGLVGTATYEGDLTPFWPYLVFGQWTHVGKGATFGLGSYQIADRGV